VPLSFFPSAIGLQSAAFKRRSDPRALLAGVLFIPIGIGGLLLLNAVSFIAVLGALFVMPRVPPRRDLRTASSLDRAGRAVHQG